ncbi:MAG: hypothetical protein DBX47_02355 [Clostridiales bacterium]|nr:MAG: hypothetical protein DBX47_02355 [Clostridiales bacterium]
MLKDDFIIKDTENILRYLSRLLFDEDLENVEIDYQEEVVSTEALFYSELKRMIAEKDINGAENALFEKIEDEPTDKILLVALKFYSDISRLKDPELNECNFTREEILEGVKEIERLVG